MKHEMFALVLAAIALSCTAQSIPRAPDWQKNLHFVGENYPHRDNIRVLLGQPDSVQGVVVSSSDHYAPFQPLACAHVPLGTQLELWRYNEGQFSYFLYFESNSMVCFTTDPGLPNRSSKRTREKPRAA
jgi:hypothetical protein